MAGFDNEVLFAQNVDFTNNTPVSAQMTTAGDILIATGDSAPNAEIEAGALTSSTLAVSYSNPNLVADLTVSGVGETTVTLGSGTAAVKSPRVTTWIVDPAANDGTHTTIQSAIDEASSGDTIFIRPGTYTEDLSITKSSLALTAVTGNESGGLVIIVGKMTLNHTGTNTFSNIRFQTNGDYLIEDTGSASGSDIFINCYLSMTDNDAININNANRSLTFTLCQFSMAFATGVLFTLTAITQCVMFQCRSFGSASYAISTLAAGSMSIRNSNMSRFGISISGSSDIRIENSTIDHNGQNVSCVVMAGTSTAIISNSTFRSGTAQALTIGSGTTATVGFLSVNSSNSPAVGGAGTLIHSAISLTGSNTTITVTTETDRVLDAPSIISNGISFDSGSNTLANYETGSWTPAIIGSTGNPTIAYTTQLGKYTRIGNVVYYKFNIVVNTTSGGSGNLRVSGLPATASNDGMGNWGVLFTSGVEWSSGTHIVTNVSPNQTYMQFSSNQDNGASYTIQISDIANGDTITASGFYFV